MQAVSRAVRELMGKKARMAAKAGMVRIQRRIGASSESARPLAVLRVVLEESEVMEAKGDWADRP
jgi:hypothetical protein